MPMSPRLLRPTASRDSAQFGFDPRSIANCTNWYDANNSASMTFNGSTISEWRSRATGGVALTQSTASAQPTIQSASINGLPSLSFDGGDFLAGDQSIPLRDNTVFAVTRQNASTEVFERVWCFRPNSGNDFANVNGILLEFSIGTGRLTLNHNNTGSGSVGSGLQPLCVTTSIMSSSRIKLRVNASDTATAAAAAVANTSAFGIIIGAGYETGAVGSRRANMTFCEFIRYSRELTTTEISAVETYLGTKWGVTF